MAGLDTCTVAFGNTEGEFHAIEGVEANENSLRIDVLTDANGAVTEDTGKGGSEGVLLHPFPGKFQSGCGAF